MKRIGIIGYGSFTREVISCLKRPFDIFLYNFDKKFNINSKYNFKPLEEFNPKEYKALLTVVNERDKIVNLLPKETDYETFIHDSVKILDDNIIIGKGSIICANSILTTNIKIGDFSHINLNTTVGHDCIIGNYFTSGPSVNISGNCNIGSNVYIGTNAAIREKINICNDVIIGMQSSVVKNITEPGIYAGCPVIKKSNPKL